MIEQWLKHEEKEALYTFRVCEVSENFDLTDDIKKFINKEILDSYRPLGYLKILYESKDPKELIDYLENKEVLPSMSNQFSKNVWQGDVGEIITAFIVGYFRNLYVPLKKIRWKLNKEKSVFATDMIAHNNDNDITDMFYYEIKTKQDISEKKKGEYITVIAYNGLKKDEDISNEALCDFLSRMAYEKNDFDSMKKYNDIVNSNKGLNRNFEIYIIGEKSTYKEDILVALNNLNPTLNPLSITIVLIDGFKDLIEKLRNEISLDAVDLICKNK